MQIKQETVEKILYYLVDAIEEKQSKINDLNYVVMEQSEENVIKSEQLCELLRELKELKK